MAFSLNPMDFLDAPDRADKMKRHNPEREAFAQRIREQAGQYDPAEMTDLQGRMQAPADDAFNRVAAGMSQAYAARGLQGTPVAGAAQAGAAGGADILREAAVRRARDAAREGLRRRTLDQYGVLTDSWGKENEANLAKAAREQEAENQMWQNVALLSYGLNRDDGGGEGGGHH